MGFLINWVEVLTKRYRCFLFLVNYARMKPDVALKALPTLEEVSGLGSIVERFR
jgi:hypothetical protein